MDSLIQDWRLALEHVLRGHQDTAPAGPGGAMDVREEGEAAPRCTASERHCTDEETCPACIYWRSRVN